MQTVYSSTKEEVSCTHLLCLCCLQHKENLRVTVEGANNGGLLSRINGLSLFVPVSQLEKKGHNEWWSEQVGALLVAVAVISVQR